jgi:hypothetical protein
MTGSRKPQPLTPGHPQGQSRLLVSQSLFSNAFRILIYRIDAVLANAIIVCRCSLEVMRVFRLQSSLTYRPQAAASIAIHRTLADSRAYAAESQ